MFQRECFEINWCGHIYWKCRAHLFIIEFPNRRIKSNRIFFVRFAHYSFKLHGTLKSSIDFVLLNSVSVHIALWEISRYVCVGRCRFTFSFDFCEINCTRSHAAGECDRQHEEISISFGYTLAAYNQLRLRIVRCLDHWPASRSNRETTVYILHVDRFSRTEWNIK